jgi:hypothetical protein
MAYTKRIVCLANSSKNGGRCFAGREVDGDKFGPWIRAVSSPEGAELQLSECCYENKATPKLLDIIDISFRYPSPQYHQVENHVIDASPWVKIGELQFAKLDGLCQWPDSIWTNKQSAPGKGYNAFTRAEVSALHHSLLLIKPDIFSVEVRHGYSIPALKKYYIFTAALEYKGVRHKPKLTDPIARWAFTGKDEGSYVLTRLYACMSLTQAYERDDQCHMVVAAIIKDPSCKQLTLRGNK